MTPNPLTWWQLYLVLAAITATIYTIYFIRDEILVKHENALWWQILASGVIAFVMAFVLAPVILWQFVKYLFDEKESEEYRK